MKHIADHMRFFTPGVCAIPTCGAPVADMTARDRYDAYLCAPHAKLQAENDVKRKAAELEAEKWESRVEIAKRVDAAIPYRYSDVRDPTVGTEEEKDAALELLNRRVQCSNLMAAIEQTAEAAEHVARTPGAVVLFAGLTGTGKTTLAACLFRMVVNKIPLIPTRRNPMVQGKGLFGAKWEQDDTNPYVTWTTATALFEADAKSTIVNHAKYASLVAIDDIGNEPTQQNLKPVPSVIWQRHEDMRALVLTSGWVNPGAYDDEALLAPLKGRYDEAFVRRISNDKNLCRIIRLQARAR